MTDDSHAKPDEAEDFEPEGEESLEEASLISHLIELRSRLPGYGVNAYLRVLYEF